MMNHIAATQEIGTMETTIIEYQIFAIEDPHYLIAKRQSVQRMYRIFDGADAANVVGDMYFNETRWRELFGEDESACVCIEIIEPPEFAGFYEVNMERLTKADARSCSDPRLAA